VIVGTPDSVMADIAIAGMAFNPANLEVTVGQYVRWINFDDIAHTTTAASGYWDSGNMDPGDVFILRADSAGMFDYICTHHPEMTGMLTVDPVADYDVMIFDNYFDPSIIRIQPGQTIRWMNMGSRTHTTTSNDGYWDSGMLSTGQNFFFTFNNEGVFDYHCEMHPLIMLGTVIVGKPDSVAFDIQMGDNFYVPAETTITIGENIRWINFGAMEHTVTDTSADRFDSGTMQPGDVFTWHADTAGVFHYICTFHPGMAGTLTVLDTTTSNGCPYVLGDINGNGAANGIDVTYGVSYFKGGNAPPISCDCGISGILFAAGDVNGNCVFNGIDITFYVGYLKGGAPLAPCANCPPAPPLSISSAKSKT
jgi:plastocyanin